MEHIPQRDQGNESKIQLTRTAAATESLHGRQLYAPIPLAVMVVAKALRALVKDGDVSRVARHTMILLP